MSCLASAALAIAHAESQGMANAVQNTHPPIRERFAHLVLKADVANNATCWSYTACLLIALLRRSAKFPQQVQFSSPKHLCLHDAAAAGCFPELAESTDAAPAGIALSAVASAVANNYVRCHENAEQLIALLAWVGLINKPRQQYGSLLLDRPRLCLNDNSDDQNES